MTERKLLRQSRSGSVHSKKRLTREASMMTSGEVDCFPPEITRVLLNLISSCFCAATKRKGQVNDDAYEPTLSAATNRIRVKTASSPDRSEKVVKPTMSVNRTVTCLRSASTQASKPQSGLGYHRKGRKPSLQAVPRRLLPVLALEVPFLGRSATD